MKERPILFSGPMVRAILDGTKTQTRRVAKLQPRSQADIGWHGRSMPFIRNPDVTRRNLACPFGHPGDRLWVREAWKANSTFNDLPPRDLPTGVKVFYLTGSGYSPSSARYRHARFMPRWASRITLEITDVRVQRLHEISEADAIAEGTREPSLVPVTGARFSERDVFAALWQHINGSASWNANPWVWALTFQRVMP